ncbi:MAG: SUMF1/EgtB/PvdO family nonheme iron enzyme [Rhodospirillaceae bacterium]
MLRADACLEEYRIIDVLGAGGFGVTYRARDERLDKVIAIKEYLPGHLAHHDGQTVRPKTEKLNEEYRKLLKYFLDEARHVARIDHKNVVRVRRCIEANGTAYMVMDFIDGDDLGIFLESLLQPMTEPEFRRIAEALLDGLAAVHAEGLIHRDIKPDNIIVRRVDGLPVILDFGAARHSDSTHFTKMLTPGYAPYEQYLESGKQGPWTDIYALAAVFYQMISGSKPTLAVQRKISDDMPAAVVVGQGRYSESLLQALDWGLRVDDTERPRSVDEWRSALLAGKSVPDAMFADAEDGSELRPGYCLNNYVIVRTIKHRSIGITYLATDNTDGSLVQIEEFQPKDLVIREANNIRLVSGVLVADWLRVLEGFREESRKLSNIVHPTIQRVFDHFDARDTAYRIVEHEDCDDLESRLSSQIRPPAEEELLSWLKVILNGLEMVHDAGCLHLNITPQSLYFRKHDNSPVLRDFSGVLRLSVAIHAGQMVRPYRAYELFTEGANFGPWTDIYALAAVLYRMISGTRPLASPDRLLSDRLVSARQIGQGRYPEPILRAIDHGLRLDSYERPKTIARWRKEILESGGGERITEYQNDFALDETHNTFGNIVGTSIERLGAEVRERYVNWSVLGKGSTALVYRAFDTELQCDVAIKVLKPEIINSARHREMFARSIRNELVISRRLRHAGICAIHDIYDGPRGFGVVMDIISGGELRDWMNDHLNDRVATADLRLVFLRKIAEALAYAHTLIVHRDLKPQNIFLRDGDVTKPVIMDFGLSIIGEKAESDATSPFSPKYMAPEQFESPDKVDRRADLFALGIIAYELFTGQIPPTSLKDILRLRKPPRIPAEQIPRPSSYNVAVRPALDRIIIQLMAYDPDDRFQSADDLCYALKQTDNLLQDRLQLSMSNNVHGHCTRKQSAISLSGGEYYLGSIRGHPSAKSNELPPQKVILTPFRIDPYLVTNRDYSEFVTETGYPIAPLQDHPIFGAPDHPVVCITFEDACAFAHWAGGSLPSEVQWEYAARGGVKMAEYPWGSDPPTPMRANINGVARGTTPVGAYPEGTNLFGLHDMCGNIWEWCLDIYAEDFYSKIRKESLNPVNIPAKPDASKPRTLRGGSFSSVKVQGRCAFRAYTSASERRNDIGFRLVYRDD